MFDIGAMEILVIAIIAIIVVGPKDLPQLLRKIGSYVSQFKRMASDFQSHLNETVEDAGLKDVQNTFEKSGQHIWTNEDDENAQAHNDKIMKETSKKKSSQKQSVSQKTSKSKASSKKTAVKEKAAKS